MMSQDYLAGGVEDWRTFPGTGKFGWGVTAFVRSPK